MPTMDPTSLLADTSTSMLPSGLLDDVSDDDEFEGVLTSPLPSSPGGDSEPGDIPSIGSAGHYNGTCRPCAWEPKAGGCSKGSACNFCHLCEEGEVKKRKKQRIVALRESRARKKLEKSKIALPPGPVSLNHPLTRTPGQLIYKSAGFMDKEQEDKSCEEVEPVFGTSPQTVGTKEKDSEDDTDSTAASSDKEAPVSFQSAASHTEMLLPPMAEPVVLCRDGKGMLFTSPLPDIMMNKHTEDDPVNYFVRLEL